MSCSSGPEIVNNNLVLHLDAANIRKSYPGTGTTWTDVSGYGNDGALVNSPTYDSGNLGSIVFDGSSNQYVNCGTTVADIPAPWTIGCWFYYSSQGAGSHRGLMGNSGTSPTGSGKFIGVTSGGYPWAIVYDAVGSPAGTQQQLYGNYLLSQDTWNMMYLTHDGSTIRLYLNDDLVASQQITGYTPSSSTFSLAMERGAYWPLWGNISDAMIYNQALTMNQVIQNYEALKGRP